MKKVLFSTMLLAFVLAFSAPATAEVSVGVRISLPPLIVFASPPEVVVIPETYVYVVPDAPEEIFFYNGWWWRPWEGRWYRSRYYDSGWTYYRRTPSFYTRVPRSWRDDYRERRWGGHPWNYQRIPHQEVKRNWSTWQKTNHWEKQQTWGVQGLKPRAKSKQQPGAVQQKSRPQTREAATPQRSQPQQQQREVQPQRSQPQQREAAPQQAKPARGKPEKAQGKPEKPEKAQGKPDRGQGKPDKGDEEKQDRGR